MANSQGLFDALAGATGHGIDRAGLNNFIATSQARNGLVSAQTQDAMIKAQQGQEQLEAYQKIHDNLRAMGAPESEAALGTSFIVAANNHDPKTALQALGGAKLGYGNAQSQLAGQQMAQEKVNGPVTVPENFMMPPGSPLASTPVQQSPEGVAHTAELNALAVLNAHKNSDPAAFRQPQLGATSPEGQAALAKAVAEGRLDPTRLNSRTAPIMAQMELTNPGTNFNRLHADAALQSNATFQQKAMSVDMLPGLLSHVTTLGKKLNNGTGYSDLRTVGHIQQWMNGELNDPDYTEYMTARNDTLLRLAGVMRGV